MVQLFGQKDIQFNLAKISKEKGKPLSEVMTYYHRTLIFLNQHTSCDGPKAAAIALNETLEHFY